MNWVAPKHTPPARRPMTSAPPGPTKPEAGVMVPSPATIPVAAPRTLGLPNRHHSMADQAMTPAAAEMWVATRAMAALPSAARALPALKPNHPTHSIPAPPTVMVRLWGMMGVLGKPSRGPITSAATSAATPAVMCTTTPPAKS